MPGTRFQPVLRSDELPPPDTGADRPDTDSSEGTLLQPILREVDVRGRTVLLTRRASGDVVAFASFCPHLGTPLRRATLDNGYIRCAQHQYVYDPESGRNIVPTQDVPREALQRLRPGYLRTYPVEERDGWVWVSEVPNPPPQASSP